MSRESAITRAEHFFDNGSLFELLAGRIAHPTGSQNKDVKIEMRTYLTE
ncbi:unnamed protein product, partial [marine sediment metagenome]